MAMASRKRSKYPPRSGRASLALQVALQVALRGSFRCQRSVFLAHGHLFNHGTSCPNQVSNEIVGHGTGGKWVTFRYIRPVTTPETSSQVVFNVFNDLVIGP